MHCHFNNHFPGEIALDGYSFNSLPQPDHKENLYEQLVQFTYSYAALK